MKILLVNTSERTGGAAIASLRLMRALNNGAEGVEARMLVRDKTTDDPRVLQLPSPRPLLRAKFVAERAEIFALNGFTKEGLWTVDAATHGTDITSLPAFREADVIHLNWVNQGMLSLRDVARVLRSGKRIVWTLHDMWPCTGVCHHAENCEGWLHGCGNCPKLGRPSRCDLSARTYRRKQQAYGGGKVHFVACSDWLADIARRAPLLEGHEVVSIPNAIDTDFYQPGSRAEARKRLGLPQEKRLLLFVAYKTTDEQKGINYLIEATERMVNSHPAWRDQLGVVPVGREAETLRHAFACEAYPQDYVTDPSRMRDLYRAADLLVMPTLMDNLPNTIVEAMSCGLPCVGFRVGGLPQMIQDGVNGRLARYKDAADFAELTLDTLVSSRYRQYAAAAHEAALRNYSESTVAKRYLEVYHG